MSLVKELYGSEAFPASVQALYDADQEFGLISYDLELKMYEGYETEDDTNFWFDGPPSVKMITLGVGGDGALYALWCVDGCEPKDAPVCYLGSEGSGNTLLAASSVEFMELLATGREWWPYDEKFGDPSQPIKEGSKIARFMSWYKATHGEPRAPEVIRQEAIERYGDFAAWVDAEVAG